MHRIHPARAALTALVVATAVGTMIPSVAAAATADVSIVKTDNADPISEGSELIYTLAVANAGPDVANAVVSRTSCRTTPTSSPPPLPRDRAPRRAGRSLASSARSQAMRMPPPRSG